ncbi:MAG TPA: hypothetical protein VJ914_12450 [Pseudonocardiaceae bacterium]|nr:hypothetical protein [Pseudonocardiaceae bacterium]
MKNVQRWSALGAGVCAALVLVSGCGKGNGNGFGFGGSGSGGGGAAQATAAASGANQGGGGSGGGFGQCQASAVPGCLMPKPDNTSTPTGSTWAKDGAMSETDYVNYFATGADEQAKERDELSADQFVSAGHVHWQGTHQVAEEITLAGFGSTTGATKWIDVDNNAYADDTKLTSPSIPGVWMFAIETPANDGTYTYAGFGRFGKIVMEVYAYSKAKDDPYAENQLATTAATQAGILKRAAS